MVDCFKTNALRLLLMALALLWSTAAPAKSTKEFDRHFADGQQAYKEKNYDKAISELEAAYQLDPDPVLLISIGRCHYLADRPREALGYYNRALQGKLGRSEREEVTASVAKATIKLQEQEQKTAEAQRAAEQAKLRELIASRPQAPLSPPKKPFYKTGWFWGTMAGIVATGVLVGVLVARPWERSVAMPSPMPGPGDNVFPP